MVVMAHFLDNDWTLYKRILNFVQITSHKGDDIGRCLKVCLNNWGIDKVFSITVDIASANDITIAYIKRRLKSNGTLVLDEAHLRMRCACHILNLIVKDGMTEFSREIEGIRNCVKFIHSSPASKCSQGWRMSATLSSLTFQEEVSKEINGVTTKVKRVGPPVVED
ncbi:hypothetical protein FF1_021472 [Malus domestica]